MVEQIDAYQQIVADMAEAEAMLADPDMAELAEEELPRLKARLPDAEAALQLALLPKDAADARPAMLEIRPGTGGDEAALFAGDLLRMYQRYAEARGWKVEIVEEQATELGRHQGSGGPYQGRERLCPAEIRKRRAPGAAGADDRKRRAHSHLGGHGRGPAGGARGGYARSTPRTSASTRCAPRAPAGSTSTPPIPPCGSPMYRPGIVVTSSEKSQHRNREIAMQVLKTRLYDMERQRIDSERSADRAMQVGSGDRSERIRTYNFPQGRMTDHRINLTLYKLDAVMQGDLDEIDRCADGGRAGAHDGGDGPMTPRPRPWWRRRARLRAAGVPDPARDARLLLAHAASGGCGAGHPDRPRRHRARNRGALRATGRAAGGACAGVASDRGAEFYGRSFKISREVLDPRPETETLIEAALAEPFERVLDLGTGSGCILVTLLAERPEARGVGRRSVRSRLSAGQRQCRAASRGGSRRDPAVGLVRASRQGGLI